MCLFAYKKPSNFCHPVEGWTPDLCWCAHLFSFFHKFFFHSFINLRCHCRIPSLLVMVIIPSKLKRSDCEQYHSSCRTKSSASQQNEMIRNLDPHIQSKYLWQSSAECSCCAARILSCCIKRKGASARKHQGKRMRESKVAGSQASNFSLRE